MTKLHVQKLNNVLFYFFPESSLENNMISKVVIRRLTGTGITLNLNHDTTVIRDSLIANNSVNCISVKGERSSIKLINNTFQYNSDPSTSYESSVLTSSVNYYTSFYVTGNIFRNNDLQKVLMFSIGHDEFVGSVIEIANNDIFNNTCDSLVDVEYRRRCVNYYSTDTIALANNYWRNNQVQSGSVTVKQDYSCSRGKFEVWLMENVFLNNTGRTIVVIQSRWPTSVTLNSNLLQTNVLDKSAIIVQCDNQASNILVSRNKFFNNMAEKLVDVTGNARLFGVIRRNTMEGNTIDKSLFNLFTENSNHQNSLNLTRNSLINNAVGQRRPLPYYIINSVPAAIICPSNPQISINENLFENPLFSFELLFTPVFKMNEINAKYNWWGSKDENQIILKIFDFRWRNYLPRVNFSPFLASSNFSDVTLGKAILNFREGNLLGGGVTDHIILKRENSPYTVIRDVIIYPSATLTMEKGIQINVLPYIGFHVYGRLDLLGEWDSPIKFNVASILQDSTNSGTYPLHLVNGSRPWEGIVEIFYNNTWGTVCDDGNSNSNGIVVCKQLGYEGYSGSYSYASSSSTTKPVWWRYLRCNSNIHLDISTCPFQGWGVSCYHRQLWYVRCNPGYWRGIRFRETAKTSNISHVKFERGGRYIRNDKDSYVLHFDVLRQALSDIEIRDSYRGGIKIAFQEPRLALSNILIQNSEKYTSSYGIETTSSLICYNCSVFGKNRGLNILEFNMNSFLYDTEIKRFDTLAIPELMLRKEIGICEHNTSLVIGKEDMKIVRMSTLSYSYEMVECFLTLTFVSQTTLVAAEMILSRDETFTISAPNVNTSNITEFTMSQYDMFSFGPGNLTVRYRRNAYSSSSSRKTLVLFSSKGNVSLKYCVSLTDIFYVLDNKQESSCYWRMKHQHVSVMKREALANVFPHFDECI